VKTVCCKEKDHEQLYLGVNTSGESNIGYLCETYLGSSKESNSIYIYTPVQDTNIVKIMRCFQVTTFS